MITTTCRAGFAQLDITPPLGVHMDGYFAFRPAKGVLDPLFVRAIAFGDGEKTAVLLVCDLVGIYGTASYEWPPKIAEELGLSRDSIFLCHTHTHTGPAVDHFRDLSDPQYDAWLYRRLRDAAQMSMDDLKPVTDVRAAETQTENITFVRRYYMNDGTLRTNPPSNTPEAVAAIQAPAHESDESLRLVRILREDAPELILVNFQLHPDCIGGSYISADFPGAVCRRIEEQIPTAHAVFINGCEGQQVATNRLVVPKPSGISRYESAMRLGCTIADKALELYETAPSTGMTGLACAQDFLHTKTKLDPDKLWQCDELISKFESGEIDGTLLPGYDYTAFECYTIRDLARRNLFYLDPAVTAIAFCGVAFVGLPGEPFNEFGRQIRSNSKFPMTFVACHTNGTFGYFPTKRAFDEGGYEPHAGRLLRGTGEQLADMADALLASM